MVIPSSSETISVWNEKYGFNLLKEEMKKEIMKLNTLMFHDCLRMQKTIPGYLKSEYSIIKQGFGPTLS